MKKLITICAVVGLILAASGAAQATILTVGPGQTYTSIQTAINAASSGDTIRVLEGVYGGMVGGVDYGYYGNQVANVNKSLTIVGWGPGDKVIDVTQHYGAYSGNNTAFAINADNVIISGFTVYFDSSGAGNGIALSMGYSGATIADNVIYGFGNAGILQDDTGMGSSILGNTIHDNTRGIWLGMFGGSAGGSDTIEGNILQNNTSFAVQIGGGFGPQPDAGASSLNYNNITGNLYGVYNASSNGTLDATYNWWGDVLGPVNETGSTGDPVYYASNVDYDPWLTAPIPEPATIALLGLGALSLLRRRKSA